MNLIDGDNKVKEEIVIELNKKKKKIKSRWPEKLKDFTLEKLKVL